MLLCKFTCIYFVEGVVKIMSKSTIGMQEKLPLIYLPPPPLCPLITLCWGNNGINVIFKLFKKLLCILMKPKCYVKHLTGTYNYP